MNNENFMIDESDLEQAKAICNTIKDSEIRNRAVSNALASDIVKKYFLDIEVDTTSGLHNIPEVISRIDISDIYLKDSYIDVRLYFNKNEIYVPKIHFEKQILPIAYMFLKIDESLSGALVTGFITPESIDTSGDYNGYYKVSEDSLVSYYDIEPLVVENSFEGDNNIEKMIFDYLDDKLDSDEEFYRALLSSRYYRQVLKNTANVQSKLSNINFENTQDELEISSDDNDEYNLLENFKEESSEPSLEELEILSEDILETIPTEVELDESFEFNDIEEIELLDEQQEGFTEDLSLLDESLDNENSASLDSEAEPIEINEEGIDLLLAEETNDVELNKDSEIDSNDVKDDSFSYEDKNNVLEFIDDNKQESEYYNEENFSTNTTPSLDAYEETNEEIIEEDIDSISLDEFINTEESNNEIVQETTNNEPTEDAETTDFVETEDITENTSQEKEPIEELFNQKMEDNSDLIENIPPKKSTPKLFPLIGLTVLLGLLSYFGYTKFYNQTTSVNDIQDPVKEFIKKDNSKQTKEAMPNETIENIKSTKPTNEGTAVSIPAIEQNLAASVKVSDLSIKWEVPATYVSNQNAKRYFTKIGKIIQLNLKTELLLLSKPPVTNKIAVELEFNKNSNKFAVKSVNISSGEKVVDEIIMQTINNVLNMNLKTNMNTFSTIVGNPVLVIHL